MEYLLIIVFIVFIYIVKNTEPIDNFIHKYYWIIAPIIFIGLFYFTVFKNFTIFKLIAFIIIVIGGLVRYTSFFGKKIH